MKNLKISALLFAAVSGFLLPISSVNASITPWCFSAGAYDTTFYENECGLLVLTEAIPAGLTEIRVDIYTTGPIYRNGSFVKYDNYSNSDSEDVVEMQNQPGYFTMDLISYTYAYRYLNPPVNTLGMTWDELCSYGKYYGLINGTWVCESGLDDEDCIEASTE